ncbi:MAG: HIT family protein [Thiohalorhabdus sp.]|uniref:HIT family protein n=1 Tax=Thiohalorhabdus sp. TaxID=3094134 RepID=UPI003980A967
MPEDCPFCELAADRVLWSDDHVRVVADGFPVTPGHMLIITRRHVGSYFQTTDAERASIAAALDAAKGLAEQDFQPDGFNIGINDGPAAGQTVPHLHVHLMPRYAGDAEDPRGGVRWLFPQTARYW